MIGMTIVPLEFLEIAMTRNSRLLLVDMVVPDNGVNCFSKLLDLNMLVMTGG